MSIVNYEFELGELTCDYASPDSAFIEISIDPSTTYTSLTRDDVIELAKHFNLTEKELKK